MVLYEEKLLQLIEEDERKKGLSLYSFTLTVARSVLAVMDNILVATLNDYGHTLENPFIVDCGTWGEEEGSKFYFYSQQFTYILFQLFAYSVVSGSP